MVTLWEQSCSVFSVSLSLSHTHKHTYTHPPYLRDAPGRRLRDEEDHTEAQARYTAPDQTSEREENIEAYSKAGLRIRIKI